MMPSQMVTLGGSKLCQATASWEERIPHITSLSRCVPDSNLRVRHAELALKAQM